MFVRGVLQSVNQS